MKVSIIVPVGNKDEWKICEQSILQSINTYKGDVKAELLPCWDLEHTGAWTVRNEGLDKATGDWIAWVDCDDVVEIDSYQLKELSSAEEVDAMPHIHRPYIDNIKIKIYSFLKKISVSSSIFPCRAKNGFLFLLN